MVCGGWQQRVMAVGRALEENLRFLVATEQQQQQHQTASSQQPSFTVFYILPHKVSRI